MKKIIGYLIIIIINYLLISLFVFAFSLISLQNGKVYDIIWIKYVQKKIYDMTGFRNVFQHNTNDCVKFDENLIYVPKVGECEFSNPDFKTKLNFDEVRRLNMVDDDINENEDIIAVIGDSIAMGWGVANDETYSYNLQKLSGKKVVNFGVSSYGTIREIKRLKLSKYYNQTNTIVIQYHLNDFHENMNLDPKKKFNKEDFNYSYLSQQEGSYSLILLLKIYKKTLRLLFSHINDLIFPEKNLKIIEFNKHLNQLNKIISENLSGENKRIIVFTTIEPWEKFEYEKNKKFDDFEFFEIKFKHHQKFIVDEHPNQIGHKYLANQIHDFINYK